MNENKEKTYKLTTGDICTTTRSAEDIIKDYQTNTLQINCAVQRRAGQWDATTKSEYIASLVKREYVQALTTCKELPDDSGDSIEWLVDGLQRVTTLIDYIAGGFKICNKIELPIVTYKDRNGDTTTTQVVDLRGKGYADLPPYLQDRIMKYPYPTIVYYNCTPDMVGYYIRRINRQKAMTASQKALTHIDGYADIIKDMADQDFWDYATPISAREKVNGTVERAIIEAVMLVNHPGAWIKKPEDMARWLNDNGDDKDFETVEDLCEELAENLTSDALEVYTVKDAALWIATYAAYRSNDLEPKGFNDFISAFVDGDLHGKKVSGVPGVEGGIASYDDLLEISKATKDKIVIARKVYVLQKLMKDFFGIVDPEPEPEPESVEEEANTTAEESAVEIQEEENIEHHDDSIIPEAVANDVELSSMLAAMTKDTYIATNAALTAGDAWWIVNQIYPGDETKETISDASLLMATLDDWCVAVPDDSWLLDLRYLIQCAKFVSKIVEDYCADDDDIVDLFGKVASANPEDYTTKGALYTYLMSEYDKISAGEKTA